MEHDAQFAGILGRAHLLADVGHRNNRVGLTLAGKLLDQMRTHELAVIGDGVVHGQRVQGWDGRGIAIGLARQRQSIPVLVSQHREVGRRLTTDARIERLKESHLLQALAETAGILAVILDDELGHTDVG